MMRFDAGNCIHIGLINNMSGSALEAAERQFRILLEDAAEGLVVRLSLFALPDVPRSDECRRRINNCYSSIRDLWNTRLDGLIVTGTEPAAPVLRNEPYWQSLTNVLDWAEHNTYSAIWSCLAAHAAVLQIDGIERRPLHDKRFGIFECATVSDKLLTRRLTAGVPDRFCVPHSRWNEVSGEGLEEFGYQVLTRSEDAGVDAFIKQRKSLFVFFQGHPEYEADSLLLEYRRDVRRFLRGENDSYPAMPRGYFDEDAAALLAGMRERALCDRREELLEDYPAALLAAKLRNTWRPAAVGLYRNWLQFISARKTVQHAMRNKTLPMGRPSKCEYERVGALSERF